MYKKLIEEQIVQILKDGLPSGLFKAFYVGDPLAIPQSQLPCLCIVCEQSKYAFGATGHDEVEYRVQIKAVFNKKNFFNKSPQEYVLEQTVKRIIEGRDEATGRLQNNTLLGILRRNVTLEPSIFQQEVTVSYLLANQRQQDLITYEAIIEFSVRGMIEVDDRV